MKKQIIIDKLNFDSHILGITKFPGRVGFVITIIAIFVFNYTVGLNLVVCVFLMLLSIYLKCLYKDLGNKPYKTINLLLLFLCSVTLGYYFPQNNWQIILKPFCMVSMLSVILFNDLVLSLLITLASVITIQGFTGISPDFTVLFLSSGLLSAVLVFGARRRNTIINAGIIIGLVETLLFAFIQYFNFKNLIEYGFFLINGISSGIIVVGVLPIFEYIFGTITNIKLLELADFNNPLLNRLMLEAPGTYHHSLIVGNLSEAASKAVGANSLLARVGAYYHDIGKLQKPDYFTENQGRFNAHETLAPNISKMVIINHVKEGVELAKKYRLNARLIDFIQQHHGKSLVYFFYHRALENLEEDQPEIAEEVFRYPGPKPNTKETAVVLLADSVEAATRTLNQPSPAKIEEEVHKIINNKFIDGQLDECDLTLKDMELIANVFIHILSGIYHTRIIYPQGTKERSENNHKKSPKENSHQ
jgi:hypothetical protein